MLSRRCTKFFSFLRLRTRSEYALSYHRLEKTRCAQLAAKGRFFVPVAGTFGLEDWREALDISLAGRAHGKLVLAPDKSAETA